MGSLVDCPWKESVRLSMSTETSQSEMQRTSNGKQNRIPKSCGTISKDVSDIQWDWLKKQEGMGQNTYLK